jgi:hypothetical protein
MPRAVTSLILLGGPKPTLSAGSTIESLALEN